MIVVKKGRCYRCINTVYMNGHENDVAYRVGKIYKSEQDRAITDEKGEKDHFWLDNKETERYFVRIYNKRHGNCRGNRS